MFKKMENKKVRHVEYVQQVKLLDVDAMKSMLEQKTSQNQISKYAYIKHDKDINEEKEPVEEHIHCILKFPYPTRMSNIKSWFKCDINRLELIKGSWVTACRYLTHLNHPNKHQYSAEEVICNFNYNATVSIIGQNLGRKKTGQIPKRIRHRLDKIVTGKISVNDYDLHFTNEEFFDYRFEIENAIKLHRIRLERKLSSETKQVKSIFIHGPSGTGKTTLAKGLAQVMYNGSYFISGSANDPLDGYKEQPCIIFDDIRPQDMSFGNYIKLMDPNVNSSYKSRYRNKLDCSEYKIITTPLEPNVFFDSMKKDVNEDIKQFYRRHHTFINVTKDTLHYYTYNEETEKFDTICTGNNHVYKELDIPNKRVCKFKEGYELAMLIEREVHVYVLNSHTSDNQSTTIPRSDIENNTLMIHDVIQECTHIDTPRVIDMSQQTLNEA